MISLNLLDVSFVAVILLLLLFVYYMRTSPGLPPGPRGIPFAGNLLDMPSENEWVTFAQWGRSYGDISSVTIFGQPLIIINSSQAAVELLDKRSYCNSDRPEPVFAGDMIGWNNTLVLLQTGERFRRFRKFFYTSIGTVSALRKFHPAKQDESKKLLRRILSKPEDLKEHIKYSMGGSLMRDTYGYVAKEANDPYIEVADKATDQFSRATQAPGYLVDFVPALRYLPDWFPGTHFKKEAHEWAATLCDMVDRPFSFVKRQIDSGNAAVSFTSELMDTKAMTPSEEYDLKWASASLYSGGSDTTVSAIYSFFLAMTLFPEVAQRAQAEIDAIVGSERLPTFSDRPDLPYVNAVVNEVLRWHSTVPICVAHRTSQDDLFRGYLIKKNSLILVNIWGMNHDERVYKNPMVFNPERYFSSGGNEPDPRKVTFGFGRRACPGSQLADANIFITVATALSVFNISKTVENGIPVNPIHANEQGTISHPVTFKCSITTRSDQAIALIHAE